MQMLENVRAAQASLRSAVSAKTAICSVKTKSCRKEIPMLVGISAVSNTLPLFFCENNPGSSNLLNSATWKAC